LRLYGQRRADHLFGVTGWFEKVMNRIPVAIASALLAGVLARFGIQAFAAAQTALPLVLLMLAIYLLGKRLMPRYAVVLTLLGAIIFVVARGQLAWSEVNLSFAMPVFVMPKFTLAAIVSLAIPLFVVTMASQNLPGVAAIHAAGYGPDAPDGGIPVSKIITLSGLATLVLAPFGAFALNLSAITAAICMGKEAHEDPAKRYTAAVCCGAIYIVIGIFGAAITGLLTAFPKELVVAIAGLALLGTIGSGLAAAVKDESHREAALITFLVTLSGVVIAGVGSAFWGVVAGAIALFVQQYGQQRRDSRSGTGKPAPTPANPFQTMNILFVADPLESFKIYKDTTFLDDAGGAAARPPHQRLRAGGHELADRRESHGTGAPHHADGRPRTTGSRPMPPGPTRAKPLRL
jgi:benzoate membrane transport protein